LHVLRYLIIRYIGAPAWLAGHEPAVVPHEQAAAATHSASLTTTSVSK
jgi:hypothetical protein